MKTAIPTPILQPPATAGPANPPPPDPGPVRWPLIERILPRSVAHSWHEAKAEWHLAEVFFTPPGEYGACLCGHGIREHCVIRNRLNGNEAVVGNCCVKRFMDLPSEPIFAALRRIAQDPTRALGAAAVEHAHRCRWINEYERSFLVATLGKRSLTDRQRAFRQQLNHRVLSLARRAA